MAVTTTNIRISDINSELQAPYGTSDISLSALYSTCNDSRSPSSGSYHNLNMTPSTNISFQSAIEQYYNGALPLKVSSWANYAHNTDVNLSMVLTNNNPIYDVNYEIYLSSSPNTYQYVIIVGTLLRNNPATWVNLPDYNSGVPAYTEFVVAGNREYFIEAIFSISPGGFPCIMNVAGCSDTDAVGPDTTRTSYTNIFGPYDLDPVGGIFQDVLICDGSWGWPSPGIAWNKRTSFNVDFN